VHCYGIKQTRCIYAQRTLSCAFCLTFCWCHLSPAVLQGVVWPADGLLCCHDVPRHQDARLHALMCSSSSSSHGLERQWPSRQCSAASKQQVSLERYQHSDQ
jgi:hypothetical protein